MIGRSFLFIIFIISLAGCEKKNGLHFPETIELASQEKKIGDDILIRYPYRIRIDDSSLYVMDLHAVDYYCHQFEYPSMKYKSSFAKRGEGPNEFLDAENIRFSKSDIIWTLDANKKKFSAFKKNQQDSVLQQIALEDDLIRTLDFDFYNDSTFIVPDYTGENRFCFVDMAGNVVKSFFTIPTKKHGKQKDIPLAQAWRSFLDYNPENGIMAMVTQLGQVIEIYDLQANTVVNVIYGEEGEPKYELAEGYAIPVGIMGYSDVYVGKDKIYAIFWGHSFDEIKKGTKIDKEGGQHIHVFNLKGEPLTQFILDRYITGFSIDEENKKITALDVNSNQPIVEYIF